MRRIHSVDFFRILAIIAVISIHTKPFETTSSPIGEDLNLPTILNLLARFSVPLFFVLSGFFWASKFEEKSQLIKPTLKMIGRIAHIFIAWSAIYLVLNIIISVLQHDLHELIKTIYWTLLPILRDPFKLILQGTEVHLWFLTSLIFCYLITGIFIALNSPRALIFFSILCYAIGLAGKAYSDTSVGFHVDFNFRDGPFFGLVFFVSGYMLQRKSTEESRLKLGLLMSLLGLILQFSELLALRHYWGTSMEQDYVIGTYFYGVGMACIALSNTSILSFTGISSIGSLVLGIYASHFLFFRLLLPVHHEYGGSLIWEVTFIAAVFLFSYLSALILSKTFYFRKIVV